MRESGEELVVTAELMHYSEVQLESLGVIFKSSEDLYFMFCYSCLGKP